MTSESSDPLAGVRAKINRAGKHREDLRGLATPFAGSDSHEIVREKDADGREHRWRVFFRPKPDVTCLGIVLGDFLHNLRSALDHLAWQLVIASNNDPSRRTEFPIFTDLVAWKNGAKRKMRGMSSAVKAEIKGMQPFERSPQQPQTDPLWLLHQFDIMDKHRLITPLMLGHYESMLGLPAGYDSSLANTLEDGAVLLTIWPDEPVDEMNMKLDVAFDIGITDGKHQFRLAQIVNKIPEQVEAVVDHLSRYL